MPRPRTLVKPTFSSSSLRWTSPKYCATSASVSLMRFCSMETIFFGRTRA